MYNAVEQQAAATHLAALNSAHPKILKLVSIVNQLVLALQTPDKVLTICQHGPEYNGELGIRKQDALADKQSNQTIMYHLGTVLERSRDKY